VVDDPNDCGVYRRRFAAQRFAGGSPLDHHEHFLMHTCANGIDGEQRRAAWCIVETNGLYEQELGTTELGVFLRRDHRSDYASELHKVWAA
jgi:hypothetical protein